MHERAALLETIVFFAAVNVVCLTRLTRRYFTMEVMRDLVIAPLLLVFCPAQSVHLFCWRVALQRPVLLTSVDAAMNVPASRRGLHRAKQPAPKQALISAVSARVEPCHLRVSAAACQLILRFFSAFHLRSLQVLFSFRITTCALGYKTGKLAYRTGKLAWP